MAVAHLVQAMRFRIWWLFPTAIFCGVSELVGWGARLYSSGAPQALIPFEIQCALSVAMVFFFSFDTNQS
jgi:hypothetical protein